MMTLILIGFLVLFGVSFLSYTLFWYETANSDLLSRLEEMSGGKTGWWMMRGFLSSVLAQFLLIFLYPLGFLRKFRFTDPDPACPFPPVLFVHGLYHNASAWSLYRLWFKKAGFHNLYAWEYNSFRYSFSELEERLDRWIKETAGHFPGKGIILVGHSLGGLLVRAYTDGPAKKVRIVAAVALGAPHQGSKLSVLSVGKLGRSLAHRGPLIERIEKETFPSGIPCLNLYSPVDNIVLPADSLQIPHSDWNHQQTAPLSHVAMLFHKKTAFQVLSFLKEGCQSGSDSKN